MERRRGDLRLRVLEGEEEEEEQEGQNQEDLGTRGRMGERQKR